MGRHGGVNGNRRAHALRGGGSFKAESVQKQSNHHEGDGLTMHALQTFFRAMNMRRERVCAPDARPDLAARAGAGAEAQETIAWLQRENDQLRADSRARSQWFASAVHDLRQPLQSLMLFSEALAEAPSPLVPQHVARVQQSVASLDRLCESLLDLAQIEAGPCPARAVPVALAPVFDELRHTFGHVARARGLRLVVRPSCLSVLGDAPMLTRMLNNLVGNALRYTRRGGVLVGARRLAGAVRIVVCDTGMGIAAEHQGDVFQPFYQVPAPGDATPALGHGLGLSGVRQLAQLQGASVSLRSRCNRGTTVSVCLAQAGAGAIGSARRP